jgi:hypothetical protein
MEVVNSDLNYELSSTSNKKILAVDALLSD